MTTTQEIMETFDAVWWEAMHLPPRTLVLDRLTMEVIEVVSAEQRWLDRLNSPAGLKALFPALKG
ncbi:hypothetical protein [Rhizobacter sp. OV335]|uniref:hypothetical protein n=1 Tax=Rhizobacter sp. OV335 TaxID=1500264 RepID=UPI00091427B4|nr:hypothetical protein [Rhizobacter sp. OV335]SHN40269.1 hypothetical protein SAMN02787076_06194 [Rhizobacter sp. OV335]